MARRPGPLRIALPWLFALALVGLVANRLHEALRVSDDDLVEQADSLRVGDREREVEKDPIAALHILDPLLAREPDHFGARLAAARAWGDLRSFDKAVEQLNLAAEHAANVGQASAAKRLAVNFLISAGRYDDAVAAAQDVVDLLPDTQLPPLQLGAALYKGSVASQEQVVQLFVGIDKGDREIEIERRIEAYITDLWGTPDVLPLVDFLAPEADSSFRLELEQLLSAARRRFLDASEAMASFRDYDGFDVQTVQAYVELLLRSGRIFESHIEASVALRQDGLPLGTRRTLREAQAACVLVLGEYALAGDAYEVISEEYERETGWAPPRFPSALIEYRMLDQDWDWILANDKRMRRLVGDDIWWSTARAKALMAVGRLDEAKQAIDEPFTSVSLGTLMPHSVRGAPQRRREVLMLAFQIYDAVGDPAALSALESLLEKFPDDLEARRLRAGILRDSGYLESATDDAFRLLRQDRRDLDDFDLWISMANELSLQRHGRSLEQRAVERVEDETSLRRAALQAAFESSQVRQRKGARSPVAPHLGSFSTSDPALAFAVIRERIRRNDLERARNGARELVQAHPQVQEFRYRLGRLLVREGQLDQAVDDFREVLHDVPGDTETLDLAMRVEIALGHHERAAELVNKMILADPLGVGAVRYAQVLLERGLPQRSERLIERLLALWNTEPGLDVLTMAARAQLAQGEFAAAGAVLKSLTEHYPNSEDVALLGLELGLAQEHEGLIDAAVRALQPLSAGLFPDQVGDLAARLLGSRRFDELLAVFPPEQRELPSLVPALRPLAEAAKAVGDVDEADRLLSRVDDSFALRDRFLLLALDGRTEEASRRLRLSPGRRSLGSDLDLCLLAGTALTGSVALTDDVPTAKLRELGLDLQLDARELELLDGCLRLLPALGRLDGAVPPRVTKDPVGTYPRAGGQLARLVDLARTDPAAAGKATRSLLLMLLAGERGFWSRETRFLAEHVLELVPGLQAPSVMLAQRMLEGGDAKQALQILRQVLAAPALDPGALQLFIEASREFGHEEWGMALALLLSEGNDDVTLLLADALVAGGQPQESMSFYEKVIANRGPDARALAGLVRASSALRLTGALTTLIQQALAVHAEDATLLKVCAEALAGLHRPEPETVEVMQALSDAHPGEYRLDEALARAWIGDAAHVEPVLHRLLARMEGDPVELHTDEANSRLLVLMGAANTARLSGLPGLARELNTIALRLDPGNVLLYRELAFLELAEGHLDTARRYLEVLSFVDRTDKEAPLALAKLLFEQVGQPQKAAEVVRRAFLSSMPPLAVEILAAESYLRGRIDDALASFQSLRSNPAVTVETVLDVGRMAFAARRDTGAAAALDLFLTTAPRDHPSRSRAESMRKSCIHDSTPPPRTAQAKTDG